MPHILPRLRASVAATALVGASLLAPLRGEAQVHVGASVGANFSRGDAADELGTGWTAAANLWLPLSGPIGVRLDGGYSSWGYEGSGTFRAWHATANAVWTLPPLPRIAFRPYFLAGAGLYNLRVADPESIAGIDGRCCGGEKSSVSKLGVDGGGGVLAGYGRYSVFIESIYHHVFSDAEHFAMLPVSFGVRIGLR